ncbi:MAG TPA: type II toxin-antitoxin system RelE/ParE family toxin [Rhodanobacteraceae bacterium]|nr:type II toxin-antitoxin system RelE/ParE family toxin [Rhodanobacteraceae bacterium]
MIKTIRHRGIARLYATGNAAGVQASHVKRLRLQLAALDTAQSIEDLDVPGFRLHALKGKLKGRWSISVNGNWRLTFEFTDGNVYVLDSEDYH